MAVDFIFLLSPNNSGTTVIGQYIASQTGGYLPPYGNYEGQMAPGVRKLMRDRPWDPSRQMDWPVIRQAWEKLATEAGKSVFVECSPPNLLRAGAIAAEWGDRARLLCSVSNPYSFVASSVYNYNTPPVFKRRLAALAREWVERAAILRDYGEANPGVPRMTYEAFCADPTVVNRLLNLPVRPDYAIAGKGRKTTSIPRITDLSLRNIAFLTFAELDEVSAALEPHADLLRHYGYAVEPGAALIARAAAMPAQFHAGLVRRAAWEAARPDDGKAGG